jgi:predicted amidohydrolase
MRAEDRRVRNKALLFTPQGELGGFYAKRRPFTPGGESEHYIAGEKTAVFNLPGCRVAPLICYDLRFPELFRASAATHQPELFVVIANWPQKRILHWTRLLQARAIENQAFVVGVNRVGTDPFYIYTGHSSIVDFNGDILQDAGETDGFIGVTLDLATLRKYREGLPFLKDLRES